jgi:hypothetical protein
MPYGFSSCFFTPLTKTTPNGPEAAGWHIPFNPQKTLLMDTIKQSRPTAFFLKFSINMSILLRPK